MQSSHTAAQTLFEELRIAAREGDTTPFIVNKDKVLTLNRRQLSDLVEIIVVTPNRQHFLAHLIDAGVDFNNQLILERLAENAKDWQDPVTQSTVTLMALGVKWSKEVDCEYIKHRLLFNDLKFSTAVVDEYNIAIVQSRDRFVDIYTPQHASLARIRNKIHALFNSNQASTKKVWDYVHKLYLYCCAEGLKKCVASMLLFTWPAPIIVYDTKNIISRIKPDSNANKETKNIPQQLSITSTCQSISQQQTESDPEFVTFPEVNCEPLIMQESAPINLANLVTEETKKYETSLENVSKKRGVIKIEPKPHEQFIDVNYKNEQGQTGSELAREHEQSTAINHSINKRDEAIRKIIHAVILKNFDLFQKAVNEHPDLIKAAAEKLNQCKKPPFLALKYQQYLVTLKKFDERMSFLHRREGAAAFILDLEFLGDNKQPKQQSEPSSQKMGAPARQIMR